MVATHERKMRIIAVGRKSSDFKGYFGTLSKYSADGQTVNLIMTGISHKSRKTSILAREKWRRLGITKVHVIDKFERGSVTQENVKALRSIIEKINPMLAILPFYKTSNRQKQVLAYSSLLACRGVKNILMYETSRNKNFLPNVFFPFGKEARSLSYLTKANSAKKRKRRSAFKSKSNGFGTNQAAEAFTTHRLVLLDDSEII